MPLLFHIPSICEPFDGWSETLHAKHNTSTKVCEYVLLLYLPLSAMAGGLFFPYCRLTNNLPLSITLSSDSSRYHHKTVGNVYARAHVYAWRISCVGKYIYVHFNVRHRLDFSIQVSVNRVNTCHNTSLYIQCYNLFKLRYRKTPNSVLPAYRSHFSFPVHFVIPLRRGCPSLPDGTQS